MLISRFLLFSVSLQTHANEKITDASLNSAGNGCERPEEKNGSG